MQSRRTGKTAFVQVIDIIDGLSKVSLHTCDHIFSDDSCGPHHFSSSFDTDQLLLLLFAMSNDLRTNGRENR